MPPAVTPSMQAKADRIALIPFPSEAAAESSEPAIMRMVWFLLAITILGGLAISYCGGMG